jgi:sugar lactone lactonase YvrE
VSDLQLPDYEVLWRAISSELEKLAASTGEATISAVLSGMDIRYVDAPEPHASAPFWKAAIGLVLVSGLPREQRQSLIGQIDAVELAAIGFADHESFSAYLDLIQARGYAIETSGGAEDTTAVAAPIIDHRGVPVGAIGVERLTPRWTRDMLHELGAGIVEATRGPSRLIGGAPRPTSSSLRPTALPSRSARVLAEVRNLIGECPVYDGENDRLFWIDMYDSAIFCIERGGRQSRLPFSEMITAIALHPDGMLIAAASGIWIIDPISGARRRFFGHPERHLPSNRMNEGKCDSHGRFWINTLDNGFAPNAGSLYRMDLSGAFTIMDTGLSVPNGLGWSPDNRKMYLADTAARVIYAYDFDEKAGSIANRRALVRLPADLTGAPDGLTVDSHGNIWVAMFDGWRISQYSPAGALVREVVMPVPRPTSCALDDRDRKKLYVTSARIRVGEARLQEAPNSGSVFEISL